MITRRALREDPFAQRVAAARRDRSGGAFVGELDAVRRRQLDQRLLLLALARRAQEQPAEQADRDERALDHHDRARRALVVGRRDAPVGLAGGVARIQDAARPQQRVRQHALDQPDGDDVADLRPVAEPRRLRQRAEQRHPHADPEGHEEDVLQRVDGVVLDRALVEHGQVPDVEVDRPGHQARRPGARTRAASAGPGADRTGCSSGPVRPEHQQQRAEVGEQQVLEHVREEQLLGEVRQRRDERRHHQHQPAVPAPLPPRRHGGAAIAQRARAQPVHDARPRPRERAAAARPRRSRGRRQSNFQLTG